MGILLDRLCEYCGEVKRFKRYKCDTCWANKVMTKKGYAPTTYPGQYRPPGVRLTKHNAMPHERGYDDAYWELRKVILDDSRGTPICYWCVQKDESVTIATEADHVRPPSRGGKNTLDNLVASCRACNVEKGNMTGEEYIDFIEVNYPRPLNQWNSKES